MPDALVSPKLPGELSTIEVDELDDGETIEAAEVRGDVSGLDAEDVTLDGYRLVGLRLVGAHLARLRLRDCVLDTCDLSGAVLDSTVWQRVELRDCRLSGAVLATAHLRHVRLVACQARAMALRLGNVERLLIEDSQLPAGDLHGTRLTEAVLTRCDLAGVDLANVTLERVRFESCRLDDVKGALRLAGATIDSGSIVPVAMGLFAALGITVDD